MQHRPAKSQSIHGARREILHSNVARFTISNSNARPRSAFKFNVTPRLFAFSIANGNVVVSPGGVQPLNGSPPNGSS